MAKLVHKGRFYTNEPYSILEYSAFSIGSYKISAILCDLVAQVVAADLAEQDFDVFDGGCHERFGASVLAQNLDAGLVTHTWHLEPFDFQVLFALAALVGDGESVRFVAGVLQ